MWNEENLWNLFAHVTQISDIYACMHENKVAKTGVSTFQSWLGALFSMTIALTVESEASDHPKAINYFIWIFVIRKITWKNPKK